MPFLRFTRDKHGYEHTAVVDTDRRRGRSRTRVLYWFRTPPNVKVGRAALDDEAIRLIEQLNPGVEFDWARLLKGQGQPSTEPRLPQQEARRQRGEGRRGQPRVPQPQAPPQPPPESQVSQPAQESPMVEAQRLEPVELPASMEVPPEFVAPVVDDTATPAHGKLGLEGVQRLRTRYADILRRIPERTADPAKREELRLQAERLNPDSWASDDAVVQGLEQYEAVLASLRELVGQKRRRRRRGNRQRSATDTSTNGSDASALAEEGEGANESSDDDRVGGETPDDES